MDDAQDRSSVLFVFMRSLPVTQHDILQRYNEKGLRICLSLTFGPHLSLRVCVNASADTSINVTDWENVTFVTLMMKYS